MKDNIKETMEELLSLLHSAMKNIDKLDTSGCNELGSVSYYIEEALEYAKELHSLLEHDEKRLK